MTEAVVYDTGALLAAERGDRLLWLRHDHLLRTDTVPVVPAVVLTQAWHGDAQPNLSRLLRGCHVEPHGERIARAAGVACARSGTRDVVAATVAVVAAHHGAVVVTSNPTALRVLADAVGLNLRLRVV